MANGTIMQEVVDAKGRYIRISFFFLFSHLVNTYLYNRQLYLFSRVKIQCIEIRDDEKKKKKKKKER